MVHPRNNRAGFTLIELLIVIAIIGVLAAMLLAGIAAVRSRGINAQETNDIKQLEIAINNFKSKYNMYPPSKIILYSSRAAYEANKATPLVRDSLQIINRMWPNIGGGSAGDPFYGAPSNKGINWMTTKDPADPSAPVFPANGIILEADQCLVWALGGHFDPTQNGCMGFSTNPKNPPMDSASKERRKDFNFPNGRLNTSKHANFPSYMDNYAQMPYIYFAPGLRGSSTPDSYNPLHAVTLTYPDATTDTVSPYYDGSKTTNNWWNASTFQIITAGADGKFSSIGDWRNGTSPVSTSYWKDNRSNFSTIVLGSPIP